MNFFEKYPWLWLVIGWTLAIPFLLGLFGVDVPQWLFYTSLIFIIGNTIWNFSEKWKEGRRVEVLVRLLLYTALLFFILFRLGKL